MNQIALSGRIAQDLELKQTEGGKKYCKFRLAVTRNKDVTDFFTCVVWESLAETVVKYCNKGTKIVVGGQMFVKSWETQAGEKRRDFEVNVRELDIMFEKSTDKKVASKPKEETAPVKTAPDMDQMTFEDDDLPFPI